ncbi:MAG TPA: ATP-binding protein [Thermoanaerobaculia bacterium]|nr:ATP-binding protein [Thermoanaerobaculia bacterium]
MLAPSSPPRALAASAAAAALVVFGVDWLASRPGPAARDPERWRSEATVAYQTLWSGLEARAREVRSRLPGKPGDPAERQAAFGVLAASLAGEETERASLLLVDPDGEAWAWAGNGLAHEPGPGQIPASGRFHTTGFAAVTLAAVEPLGAERRPWRVVAGRSLATDRLPFAPPGGEAPAAFRWSLLPPEVSAPAVPTSFVIAPTGLPRMVISPLPEQVPAAPSPPAWRRAAWGLLALAAALSARTLLAGTAMVVALGLAAGLPLWLALAAAAALAVATAAVARWRAQERHPASRWRWLRRGWGGGAVMIAVTASCALIQAQVGPLDLGGQLFGSAPELAIKLLIAALVTAGLAFAAGRPEPEAPPAWPGTGIGTAMLMLLLGAMTLGQPGLPFAFLVVGVILGANWLGRQDRRAGAGVTAALIGFSALAAALSWETTYRLDLRAEVAAALPRMAPPPPAQMDAFATAVNQTLGGPDLEAVALSSISGLDRRDLAYALWQRSPLSRRNALSALIVEPFEGVPSLFSFGMPLDEVRGVQWHGAAWAYLSLPVWDGLRREGEVSLSAGGRPWGRARWWLAPRPGFLLGERPMSERVLLELLEGTPGDPRSPVGLPSGAEFALYPPSGRALLAPWTDLPPVPPALEREQATTVRVTTPAGRAWAFSRRAEDGYEVLYLPALGPIPALERVGAFAASVVLFVALAALVLLAVALPRRAVRDLAQRALRSYPRRLLLFFAVLVLVPLLLLNLVLLRTVEARLQRDQRERGEQALAAAERAVSTMILSREPGFDLLTALDSEYLKSLSRLVDHDVNVYFATEILSSSTSELFTAGLLPRRIPGEVFARLSFLGFGHATRLNRAVGTPYLELYTPVRPPGAGEEEARLFLSVPLLAQQEEAAEVLTALERRALVVSTALIGLLVVLGGRLAASFARPIQLLVEGTRRIAAGATSVGVTPDEQELAALSAAIDDMAGRIAAGREALLREKTVAERMVENVTAGIVSLDRDLSVLLRNRVAAELLGVGVGDSLPVSLAAQERLAPLLAFVEECLGAAGEATRQQAVKIDAEGAEREWTLVWVPLPGPGEPSAILVVEDVTEVFRGQRLAAWAEMARIIAHEIKNPLTPIRLTAEHMRLVWQRDREHFDEIFDRCAGNILTQVEELQQIASEFSTYSRIPRMEALRADLRPALHRLLDGYRTAPPDGLRFALTLPAEPVMVRFDERLLGRALRNLLENAVRASAGGGTIEASLAAEEGEAVLTIADRGPGVEPEILGRIFDPYFSTHDTGTGLGLPIARRIVEEHGGSIVARRREGGGLAVEIRMPLA